MSANSKANLTSIINEFINKRLLEVNISLPCTVKAYDAKKNKVDVEIGLKRKYVGNESQDLPIINDVPVQLPRSLNRYLFFEMQKDTEGLLVFSQRSLDIWIEQGGKVDPLDARTFDLSDAIFIPGLSSTANKLERLGEGVELRNEDMFIDLLKDGKIAIQNAQEELIDLIQQVDVLVGDVADLVGSTNQTLSTDTIIVAGGGSYLGSTTALTGVGIYGGYKGQADGLKSQADILSDKIGTFKI